MCMLTYIPPFVQPDLEHLANGTLTNQDGHGFAIVAGNRLIVRHSMDEWKLIDMFGELRAKHASGPALFHSRFGTGGERSRRNCHPFRIGGDRRTVVGHNGVLPTIVHPGKGELRCDTRITAEDVMRGADLSSSDYRRRLANWMTPRNKFVILTVNPRYKQSAWIINESSGIWDSNGIWYSNDDYLPWTPPTDADRARWAQAGYWTGNTWYSESTTLGHPKETTATTAETDRARCVLCTSYGEIDPENFCRMCGTCQDCESDRLTGECQCHVPARTTTDEEDGAAAWWARQEALETAFSALPVTESD